MATSKAESSGRQQHEEGAGRKWPAWHSTLSNYRLQECCHAIPELRDKSALTLRQSLSGIRLKLWDEERKELVGFR
ncbi:MAG: hypothetical protein ACD_75C02307G0002 [uncultured bacterium]|nr:MAG: hypothetical protein ACD_75C02307G0002 [uncultured bacterium]